LTDPISTHRYAIYFAPAPSTPLDNLGRNWLGRDTRTGERVEPKLPPTISRATWRDATDEPRHYGFHATLKPPFRLAPGKTIGMLQDALANFAMTHPAFSLPPLHVARLGSFLAMTLSSPSEELNNLASDCVQRFDDFRATPSPDELKRRMRSSHTQQERDNLKKWGYPYVLDTWKFHMTLTGPLKPDKLPIFEEHLLERSREACETPLMCDSICLFEESDPEVSMLLIGRYLL
jgi:putative phosphonate metabolism protein